VRARGYSRERPEAFVILDGTLLRIDRVAMTAGRDRPYYSGCTSRTPPATLRGSPAPALTRTPR
jgi:hypothetical protein